MVRFALQSRRFSALLALLLVALTAGTAAAAEDDGFVSLFNGDSLEGWDGNPAFWRVEDGVITGQTTAENPTDGNTFLIWRGGKVGDFELKLDYKIAGGNSGIQYRSYEAPGKKWVIGGYQADIDSGDTYSGILYEERGRGILAERGQETAIPEGGKPELVSKIGEGAALQQHVKKDDWNSYHVIARGNHLIHKINGQVMSEVTDNDAGRRRAAGLLALQLHAGPPMTVQFRNIQLKKLDADEKRATADSQGSKRVVFIAGKASHGHGAHEHRAGCLLLAGALEENMPYFDTEVITNGWPEDDSVLDGADSIVIYSDGGQGHPINAHLDRLDELMKNGTGLVLIHYAVEVPKGPSGEKLLEWTGGYFEPNWSVNPHWVANYSELPEHPITRGVQPFSIDDEWYYHMRFRNEMAGVQPILTDVPPPSTLERPDGPHSGNPHVRAKAGQPQHTAWATEREDGGRGFGFTGGHVHWNWGHDEFRQLILNAIVWTAGAEVPEGGVPSRSLSVQDLEANQDEEPDADYNRERIQALLEQWREQTAKQGA